VQHFRTDRFANRERAPHRADPQEVKEPADEQGREGYCHLSEARRSSARTVTAFRVTSGTILHWRRALVRRRSTNATMPSTS
jgi:hypothetical protein